MLREKRRLCETGGRGGCMRQYGTGNRAASASDSQNGTEIYQSGDIAAGHRRDPETGIGETDRMKSLMFLYGFQAPFYTHFMSQNAFFADFPQISLKNLQE